ncbi:MAG: hypothetical protein NT027_07410 [Proteobacteria bacterium]|nr:hypothetical protein [Pseudomonadota bacterium]
MTKATSNLKSEKVSVAKDNGFAKQWGLGRLFLQVEGVKPRINAKALFIVIAIIFGFIGVFTSIKSKKLTLHASSPIGVDVRLSESISKSSDIKINSYSFEVSTNRSAKEHSKVSSRGQSKGGYPPGLIVTRRNGEAKIPPGAMVRVRLTSGASNGFTKAELLEPLAPYGETFLPSGTSILGSATSSTERLAIKFSKAVTPDGLVSEIDAVACDGDDKMPGIRGVNIKGQALSLAGAVGLNFAGGLAMGMQSRRSNEDEERAPSVKDGLLSGASVAALEKGRELSQDLKSEAPVIEISEQTEFYVLFLGAR